MASHDFVDVERRKLKAAKLAAKLRAEGMTADLVVACAADTKWLRQVERDAGVAKSSDATWALAVQDLARRPPTFEQDRRPGCGCHVDPDSGTLYEFPGWPCPHGSDEHPGPIEPGAARSALVDTTSGDVLDIVTIPPLQPVSDIVQDAVAYQSERIAALQDLVLEVDAMDWDV